MSGLPTTPDLLAHIRAAVLATRRAPSDETLAVVRSCVGSVLPCAGLDELQNHGDYDLLIVDYDRIEVEDLPAASAAIRALHDKDVPVLVISHNAMRQNFVPLFKDGTLTNLLARDQEVAAVDLQVTLHKLISPSIFGLERYFSQTAKFCQFTTRCSDDKSTIIDSIYKECQNSSAGARLIGHLVTVIDEFLTNSLFDAPVDDQGQHVFSALPRTERVTLPAHQEVKLTLAMDDTRIGVSVLDAFGSLKPRTVLNYLARCLAKDSDQIETKLGGAGLGLFMSFESLSHMVINIEPGHKTEMIGLISTAGGFRRFARSGKSFNVFVRDHDV